MKALNLFSKFILPVSILFFFTLSSCKKNDEVQPNSTASTAENTITLKAEAPVDCSILYAIFRTVNGTSTSLVNNHDVLKGASGTFTLNLKYKLQTADEIVLMVNTKDGSPNLLKSHLYIDGKLVKEQVKVCFDGGVSYVY